MSVVSDAVEVAAKDFGKMGWKASMAGETVGRLVGPDGRVKVIVSWVGGNEFVMVWEYESGDWRAESYGDDEIEMQVHMTASALAFG